VADPIQIEQVVLNIVRNAFDAMARTKPENRRLTIRTSVAEGGFVEAAVSDTGIGFVSDIEEKLKAGIELERVIAPAITHRQG